MQKSFNITGNKCQSRHHVPLTNGPDHWKCPHICQIELVFASYWPIERPIGEWYELFGKHSYLPLGYNSTAESPVNTWFPTDMRALNMIRVIIAILMGIILRILWDLIIGRGNWQTKSSKLIWYFVTKSRGRVIANGCLIRKGACREHLDYIYRGLMSHHQRAKLICDIFLYAWGQAFFLGG
jgi:hypothetical protein